VLSEERGETRVVEAGVISEALDTSQLGQRINAWIDRPAPLPREHATVAAAAASRVDMRVEAPASDAEARGS
jgi:hypothetical protein